MPRKLYYWLPIFGLKAHTEHIDTSHVSPSPISITLSRDKKLNSFTLIVHILLDRLIVNLT